MTTDFDLLVIGAGAAGSTAATLATRAGARVALAERASLGGTCLNHGCDPARTLADIAAGIAAASSLERYGLRLEPERPEWSALTARVAEVIEELRGGSPRDAHENLAEQGITLYRGEARFAGPHEVRVGERPLRAAQILIATGSCNVEPPIPGLRQAGYITNEQAVRLPALPQRLAIIGAGATGIEFAQIFARCGATVSVLDQGDPILPAEDEELVARLTAVLAREGIRLDPGTTIARVEAVSGGKRLFLERGEVRWELEVDEILVAAGRRPAADSLNLEAAGVDHRGGCVAVNERMQSSVPHIWAAGDVVGGGFTHVAGEQAKVVVANAIEGRPATFDHRTIPYSLFSDPGIARVGLTERQAREAGLPYQVGRLDFADLVRAVIQERPDGLVKLIVGADRRLLGAHILAPMAGSLIAPAVLALRCGLPVEALYETVQPYPTLAESIRWAANPEKLSGGSPAGGTAAQGVSSNAR